MIPKRGRGRSSIGRAPQWHCGGQGFDSPRLHQWGRRGLRLCESRNPQHPWGWFCPNYERFRIGAVVSGAPEGTRTSALIESNLSQKRADFEIAS